MKESERESEGRREGERQKKKEEKWRAGRNKRWWMELEESAKL